MLPCSALLHVSHLLCCLSASILLFFILDMLIKLVLMLLYKW